jgi:alkanesulfonate monooxygenase SsuD/methylene tetrahydromethanopterin reductase-like flavin-dependent oxidoreductase (luciferase family)
MVRRRMGFNEALARDAVLAGTVAEVRDKLTRVRDAGATMIFIPNMFFPKDPKPLLDTFIREVAPVFR